MELTANQFMQAAAEALQDPQLKTAIGRATGNVSRSRAAALSEVADLEALRQQGRGAKLRALHNLPELLEEMERNVIASGGRVLWAADGDEANRHVLDICRTHNLKRGVKSKSMVTEETGLLDVLQEHGIEMLETDLGEFIVQVAESHPSHIVMPVMHMTREQVRDLFMAKLGMEYTDDAADMTAFARKVLREKYLQADFGMSGGNFMIAETGTVVIVTNEGNGRLSTGMPPVHIAVVGIEKIVPTWEDFATLVQMIARNGTGQRMTVYVNIFNGPSRQGDADGPEHFYLILVDNGRSDAYASEYAEALACIRCGACLNICPVYQSVGGHAYGWVYSGPIGAVFTPATKGKENASPLPFASSLCGACKQVCPVEINIPDMLLKLRRDLRGKQGVMWRAGMRAWSFGFKHPLLYQIGGKAAGIATRALATPPPGPLPDSGLKPTVQGEGEKVIRALPFVLSGWTDKRDFPPLALESFHDWWKKNRGSR